MDQQIKLLIEHQSVNNVIGDLIEIDGLEIELEEGDLKPLDKNRQHPLYSLQFDDLTIILITLPAIITSLTGLAKVILDYKLKSAAQNKSNVLSMEEPALVINGKSIPLTQFSTIEEITTLLEKVQVQGAKAGEASNVERSLIVKKMLPVFYCYSHKDLMLRNELDKHLTSLKRLGWIKSWFDGEITAGTAWEEEIIQQLENAEIVLLLVSPDFIHSNYCYSNEMMRAIERHAAKKATVIPIILRPCIWEKTPFAHLQVLPSEGKAISLWANRDEAFLDVALGISRVVASRQEPTH